MAATFKFTSDHILFVISGFILLNGCINEKLFCSKYYVLCSLQEKTLKLNKYNRLQRFEIYKSLMQYHSVAGLGIFVLRAEDV